MSSAFLLICLIVCFKQWVEAAIKHPLWLRIVHALLYVGFVVLIHPYCLRISKIWVDRTLNTPNRLSDLSLIVMLDLLITVASFLSVGSLRPTRQSLRYDGLVTTTSRVLRRVAYFLPSPLFLASLFYLRVYMLFVLPGVSFVATSAGLALFAGITMLLAPRVCQFLSLPASLSVMLDGFVLIISIAAGVFASQSKVYLNAGKLLVEQLQEMTWLLFIILFFATLGYFFLGKKRFL